ncbi:MAG TPA: GTP-binding protein [Verrucomicrobiales bacterium]|nr:GTP-binding protein [Verrucomicrobiales bacterium]
MIQKKICMIGAPSVGKTSLVARYVYSLFSEKYLSTVGVKIDRKDVRVDGQDVTLMLWDLAGDDEYQPLKPSYLRGAAGYLLVADGTRQETLDHALDLHWRVTRSVGTIPFVLVLNKSDLAGQWEIDPAQIKPVAEDRWRVLRTSAKDGSGVEVAFSELARDILRPGQDRRTIPDPA